MGRLAVLISNWKTRSVLCLELKGATLKRGIGLAAEGKLQKHDDLRDIQSPREAPEFCVRQLLRSTHCDEAHEVVVAIIVGRCGCG